MAGYEKLTDAEEALLTEQESPMYLRAVSLCHMEHARGPFGGWYDGFDLLRELGWTKKIRTSGHRDFVSMIKPDRLKEAE